MKQCFGPCEAVRCTRVPGRSAEGSEISCAEGKWDLALYLSCIHFRVVLFCLTLEEKLSRIPEVLL